MKKLSANQLELLKQLETNKVMEWDFYGNSPTQFNIKSAEALQRKGMVNLEYVAKPTAHGCNYSIQYILTAK